MILFIHPTVCAFHFCHKWLMFIFLSHQLFNCSSPDVVLLFIPYLVFAWLIILTKLHYLTLVLLELCLFFFPSLHLLNYQVCFEFWSCPSACLQSLSAWCSLPGQLACFLCHQPSCRWKHQLVLDLGWAPLENDSVEPPQSVLKEQCPIHRWSSQQCWSYLGAAQASPCIPGFIVGMSHQTLSEVSEILASSPLPASPDTLSQKEIWQIWCDLFLMSRGYLLLKFSLSSKHFNWR